MQANDQLAISTAIPAQSIKMQPDYEDRMTDRSPLVASLTHAAFAHALEATTGAAGCEVKKKEDQVVHSSKREATGRSLPP